MWNYLGWSGLKCRESMAEYDVDLPELSKEGIARFKVWTSH